MEKKDYGNIFIETLTKVDNKLKLRRLSRSDLQIQT